ncbi:MAG: RNA polymerase sigma factor [Verrucomicrobia bacterium]|nr:RNA polymerase sigma factor [Verrucomicrobiota bacterium]
MLAVDVELKPLVQRARAREPDAWDRLFQRFQLPLYSFVYELVRHEQTSLDIVQETFINAVRHLGSLRDEERFGSWLFGIAHQKCVQHWRRAGRAGGVVDDTRELPEDAASVDLDPGEWLVRREREEEFMTALNQLPSPQRAVLLLHFLEDFSLEEIAAITGAPVGTVKSRLHHAKKGLRELLEDRS